MFDIFSIRHSKLAEKQRFYRRGHVGGHNNDEDGEDEGIKRKWIKERVNMKQEVEVTTSNLRGTRNCKYT